ncbi:type IV pilus assembly protein PilW [Noviherbaspirillum humi]|uniref:Type IV pilus assembly protein PilW n=1 Tax=Noviherbaspirillum humi TaxID=1688639 RepID=A0A239DK49_9BURK|nr:PilW family protein [Noviherbaspirillum humi]SNS32083.1 type IV pilus assembly protein PilW [Noviherbaspirillum humi]
MKAKFRCTRRCGFTLVELMVATALGMLIALVATAVMLSTRQAFAANDDYAELEENGRFALQMIGRAIRQAAFDNWDGGGGAALIAGSDASPAIFGLDDRSLKSNSPALDRPTTGVNGSDVLAIRFVGSGPAPGGDGTVFNCAGFAVPQPEDPDAGRGWSIFYVALSDGEPELRCKYANADGNWNSVGMVRGVETFQVLYGLDPDGDGKPNRYVPAGEIERLADATPAAGVGANPWKQVVAVKFAMLMRGSSGNRADAPDNRYDLFGPAYARSAGASDPGSSISEPELPQASRHRLRKTVSATVMLRNAAGGG